MSIWTFHVERLSGLTYIVGTKPLEAFVDGLEYVLPAQAHLINQRSVIDRSRARVVVHDGIEYLGHDDDFAPGNVELFERLP